MLFLFFSMVEGSTCSCVTPLTSYIESFEHGDMHINLNGPPNIVEGIVSLFMTQFPLNSPQSGITRGAGRQFGREPQYDLFRFVFAGHILTLKFVASA
jgi:hypothetical protein